MPARFDFACPTGHRFEARVSMNATETECPECGAVAPKQFTVPSVSQICVPIHMGTTRYDYLPDSGTAGRQSPEYMAGKMLAEFDEQQLAYREKAAGGETFEQHFKKTNPDIDLSKPISKTERFTPNAVTHAYDKAAASSPASE